MARVNIVKRIKVSGRWIMRSIPRKRSGGWNWSALPDGRYYVEWYEQGTRKREPAGNREQHMLDRCKAVASRATLNPSKFDLKTFRSTYATRMLRAGFDVRTVQHWMGHKSLETTMRYLVPAKDVHQRLDEVEIPGLAKESATRAPKRRRPKAGVRRSVRADKIASRSTKLH